MYSPNPHLPLYMLATLLIPLQLVATLTATQYETTTESESGAAPATIARTLTTVGGGNVRFEVIGRSEGRPSRLSSANSYMLLRIKEMKMYSIDTTKHEYSEVDVAAMQSQLISMMKAAGGDMKFSDIDYKVDDLGDGGVILGHPTRHWRMKQSMTVTTTMNSASTSVGIESAADLYFARDVSLPNNPAGPLDTSSLAQFRNLTPETNLIKARAELSRLPRNLLLRSIVKSKTRVPSAETETTSTTNVTRLETVNVPASILEIPRGYKKVEMFPLPKALQEH